LEHRHVFQEQHVVARTLLSSLFLTEGHRGTQRGRGRKREKEGDRGRQRETEVDRGKALGEWRSPNGRADNT